MWHVLRLEKSLVHRIMVVSAEWNAGLRHKLLPGSGGTNGKKLCLDFRSFDFSYPSPNIFERNLY